MRIAVLSDIHGNLTAIQAVISDLNKRNIDGCIFLGDLIDYGPHSNEVIQMLSVFKWPIYCNIWGNHEDAIIKQDFSRFSSERGRKSARFTQQNLSVQSKIFIKTNMQSSGLHKFMIDGKKCLAIHGSMEDYFWKSITPESSLTSYEPYDYVFSGHSHEPHYFEEYYPTQNPETRNRKKTIFINPGSVGQPRNLNSLTQYVVVNIETEELEFVKIEYDYEKEIADFSSSVDPFYKERLKKGI